MAHTLTLANVATAGTAYRKGDSIMSLLDQAMTDCNMYKTVRRPDGYGGYTEVWTEDTESTFKAAITFDNSLEARVAAVQGVKSLYTVTTRRNKVLMYHDVFKRLSDGKILRVTSDGDDSATPPSAALDMRQCTAEEWTPPR